MDEVRAYLTVLPLALLGACGSGGTPEPEAAPPTATVRTALAVSGSSVADLVLYGVAQPGPGSERALGIQSEAVVTSIAAPTGTAVRAGQVVAALRPSATAQLDTTRAATDAAGATAAYERAKRLRADGLVSDAEVETARAAATTANATLANATGRNDALVLRAPVAGTVQALIAKPGDLVPAGTTVATIVMTGNLRARFGIDPAVARQVRAGQPIGLSVLRSGASIATTVAGVDPQVDATTRLASVFARIPSGTTIGAGEALRASLALGGTRQGITIPYRALLDDGGRSFVFVVEGGVAKSRDVSPGSSEGDRVEVLKGLVPGERVVTEGGTALEDGMKVREENGAAAGK